MVSTLSILLSVQLFAQADEQIVALQDSVKVMIEQYGEKSEEVVNANFKLGKILSDNAKYEEAAVVFKKCLDICLEIYGEKHTSTAASYRNTGLAYVKTGNPQGILYLQKALDIRLEVLGENHASTADSYSYLGLVYDNNGDYPNAIKHLQKALNIRLEVLKNR